MELPTPDARYLGVEHREDLARFRCSTGPWFEDDVERFITAELADHHEWRRRHTDHTIISLEIPGHGMVALGAHETDLTSVGGRSLTSTFLEVAAVSAYFQGAILPAVEPLDADGKPVTLGRYLIEVLLSDIAGSGRDPAVRAIVARENIRSLSLCTRVGLRNERDDPDPRFVQRLGLLER